MRLNDRIRLRLHGPSDDRLSDLWWAAAQAALRGDCSALDYLTQGRAWSQLEPGDALSLGLEVGRDLEAGGEVARQLTPHLEPYLSTLIALVEGARPVARVEVLHETWSLRKDRITWAGGDMPSLRVAQGALYHLRNLAWRNRGVEPILIECLHEECLGAMLEGLRTGLAMEAGAHSLLWQGEEGSAMSVEVDVREVDLGSGPLPLDALWRFRLGEGYAPALQRHNEVQHLRGRGLHFALPDADARIVGELVSILRPANEATHGWLAERLWVEAARVANGGWGLAEADPELGRVMRHLATLLMEV
jgi:hypothetical protein